MRGKNVILAAALLAAWGCGDDEEGERPVRVDFDQVPANLKEIAARTLPTVKFDSAHKIQEDGKEIYEIRGKEKGGKIREVEVTPDGKVVRTE
jgi:hypothetical protein